MEIDPPVSAALLISDKIVKGNSHVNAYTREIDSFIKQKIIEDPILRHQPEMLDKIRKKLMSTIPPFTKGYVTNSGKFIREVDIVNYIKNTPALKHEFTEFLKDVEHVETNLKGYFTYTYIVSPTLNKFNQYLRSKGYNIGIWGEKKEITSFKVFFEASDNLHQWFNRKAKDPKTGKTFHGWVNCKTGGPCGRESKKSGGSYPACRPTKAACKSIKGRMYKKKSSKRVNWKKNK